jgi:glutamine synthetase
MTLSPEELRARVTRGDIDTVLVVFPDLYGRLMGKRVTGTAFRRNCPCGRDACVRLFARK